jgi:hypothetical protein
MYQHSVWFFEVFCVEVSSVEQNVYIAVYEREPTQDVAESEHEELPTLHFPSLILVTVSGVVESPVPCSVFVTVQQRVVL